VERSRRNQRGRGHRCRYFQKDQFNPIDTQQWSKIINERNNSLEASYRR
jgi:hypothetical protein